MDHTDVMTLLDAEIAQATFVARTLEQRERQIEGTQDPQADAIGEDVAQAYGRLQGLRHARLMLLYRDKWTQAIG